MSISVRRDEDINVCQKYLDKVYETKRSELKLSNSRPIEPRCPSPNVLYGQQTDHPTDDRRTDGLIGNLKTFVPNTMLADN